MVNVMGTSMSWFWGLTLTYGVFVVLLSKAHANSIIQAIKDGSKENIGRGWPTIMYLVLVLLSQTIIGIVSTLQQCGGNTGGQVAWAVAQGMFYWLLVFGVVFGLLTSSRTGPTWRSPFSNGLIGWMFSSSINNDIRALAKKATGQETSGSSAWVDAIAARLSSSTYVTDVQDPSIFDNLGIPWKSVSGKIGPLQKELQNSDTSGTEALIDKLCQRDAIANLIWFGLAGTLSALMYSTTLSNAKCSLSSSEMKKIYEDGVKNQHAAEEADANRKVYNIRD